MSSSAIVEENIRAAVTDGNLRGALRSGGLLLLHTRATSDIIEPSRDISNILSLHELHHIYPKKWCRDNQNSENLEFLRISKDEPNWVDSPANLIPMSGISNKLWDSKEPSSAIQSLEIESLEQQELLERYFVDETCLTYLESGALNVGNFLKHRSEQLIQEYLRLTRV